MAVLCHQVSPKPDGTVDVLGIVDGVVVEPQADADADPLGLRPSARLSLTALVSLRAGNARGEHVLALRSAYPSGSDGPAVRRTIDFTPDTPAASLVVPLELEIHEPGEYTFRVLYDEQVLTRMSLWVGYAGAHRPS
jgi:hypothetical protein